MTANHPDKFSHIQYECMNAFVQLYHVRMDSFCEVGHKLMVEPKALLAVQYVDQTSMSLGALSLLANVNQYLWHAMTSFPIS